MSFVCGFEKEAALKHWLTAGALAVTPMKAKASDMADTLRHAVSKTEAVQNLGKRTNDYINKFKSVRIAGGSAGKGTSAAKKGYALDLKDGHKLQLSYNKLKLHAKPGETGAAFDMSGGKSIEVASGGKGNSVKFNYNREF